MAINSFRQAGNHAVVSGMFFSAVSKSGKVFMVDPNNGKQTSEDEWIIGSLSTDDDDITMMTGARVPGIHYVAKLHLHMILSKQSGFVLTLAGSANNII